MPRDELFMAKVLTSPIALAMVLAVFTEAAEFMIRPYGFLSDALFFLGLAGILFASVFFLVMAVVKFHKRSRVAVRYAFALLILVLFVSLASHLHAMNDRLYFALKRDDYFRQVDAHPGGREALWADGPEWDGGQGWTAFPAYDPSDEIALPDDDRSDAWKQEWERAADGRIPLSRCRLSANRLEGHFFVVFAGC